jgi:hypothetical protein
LTWARIESSMPRHPKVIGLSVHAKWAFMEMLCWSVEQTTDGRINAGIPISTFTNGAKPDAVITQLVAAGLLERNGDGYVIHDFEDYQMSGARDKARREAATVRKRRERESKRDDA